MQALFSATNEAAKSNSTGKTVFGLLFATAITFAAVAGMTQQTGKIPAHWTAGVSQAQDHFAATNAGRNRAGVLGTQLAANAATGTTLR